MKLALAALAVLCAASVAGAGDVVYVASPGPELLPLAMGMQAWKFETSAGDAGTVWAKAMVGKIMLAVTN